MRRALAGVVVLFVAGALAAGYLRACTGPRPVVVATRADWLLVGVRAVATVRNDGGEGQVEVLFRIIDRQGRTYTREESAQIRRGEELEVSTFVGAPEGDYRVEAEAEFPPR